jgi:hypothetical protein
MRWTGTIIRDLVDEPALMRLATVFRDGVRLSPDGTSTYTITIIETKEVYKLTGTLEEAQAYATALARMQ